MNSQKAILAIATVLLLVAAPNGFAKRTISGHISRPDGTPAQGVGVIAWDEDDALTLGGKNDYMCSAITDARGYYKMQYGGGPWDTKVPGSTSFRPDIFLTIHAVQAGTLPVKKTVVKKNWVMAKDIVNWDVKIPGIMGKITGAPASGLRVKAFDSDGTFGGKDDPIGITTTLPDGRYVMLYGGKHYDSTPPSPGGIIGGIAEATTGVFGINYIVKHIVDNGWDNQMHRRFTSWRPDIYIKVYGGSHLLRTSRVYKDWPHRDTLVINMDLTPKPSQGQTIPKPAPGPGVVQVK
jgi:hypothetical protein